MSIDFRPYLRRRRGSGALNILTALLTGVEAYDQGREQWKARQRQEKLDALYLPPTSPAASATSEPLRAPALEERLRDEFLKTVLPHRTRYRKQLIDNDIDPDLADRAATKRYPFG